MSLVLASLCSLEACGDSPAPGLDASMQQSDGATENACPTTPVLGATPNEAEVGATLALHGMSADADDAVLTFTWTHLGVPLPNGSAADAAFTCTEAGTVGITLTVSDGVCERSASLDVLCTEPPSQGTHVAINEIETSSGAPGDWVELVNPTGEPIDISGFIVRDADDGHTYTIPTGTVLASHAYYVIEEASLGFGLGTSDSARLFDTSELLVDSHEWTAHAMTTLGRCPDGTGPFAVTVASTKGATNTCTGGGGEGLTYTAWPGADDVVAADVAATFGGNLSDITYRADAAVIFGVQNDPSRMYRIVATGGVFGPDAGEWATGKTMRYANGAGSPDAEGITFAEASSSAVYVVSERDNTAATVSRLSVLRFDTTTAGTSMTPTHEWTLTPDFAAVGPNAGIESITWVPDAYLVANGFYDAHAAATYDPADYADHGDGLFFIALETGGVVHAYALDHASQTFTRIATIATGMIGMMGLAFDRDVGNLWAHCDDACENRSVVLRIDTTPASSTLGRFVVHRAYERPTSLGNYGHEGIALAPESECVSGYKRMFFVDDALTGGHALRVGTIPCGALP